MQTILERVSFGKLASHPARARAMRDDGRHPTHVCDRMRGGQAISRVVLNLSLSQVFHWFSI
jgi:hypothetical protein